MIGEINKFQYIAGRTASQVFKKIFYPDFWGTSVRDGFRIKFDRSVSTGIRLAKFCWNQDVRESETFIGGFLIPHA